MHVLKKLALSTTAALGLAAMPAQAAVQVTAYGYNPTAVEGSIIVESANSNQYGPAGRFLSTIQDLTTMASLQRYTFCLDVLAGYYTYAPYNDVSLSSFISNAGKQNMLAGLLAYANPTIDGAGSPIAQSLSAAAFQLAIWEVVTETSSTYNLTLGNFHVAGGLTDAGTLANTYLSNVSSGSWTGNVNAVRVLSSASDTRSQNQIYLGGSSNAVPEPATWAMMLGGFAMVGAAMRRRAKVTVSYA